MPLKSPLHNATSTAIILPQPQPIGSARLRHALNAVEDFCNQGYTVAPIKPTHEMLEAGAQAGQISVETAWKVWCAMLTAAE
ncbi:hypothetical protein CCP2SC5_680005 [Azospirillaceae bacterium]